MNAILVSPGDGRRDDGGVDLPLPAHPAVPARAFLSHSSRTLAGTSSVSPRGEDGNDSMKRNKSSATRFAYSRREATAVASLVKSSASGSTVTPTYAADSGPPSLSGHAVGNTSEGVTFETWPLYSQSPAPALTWRDSPASGGSRPPSGTKRHTSRTSTKAGPTSADRSSTQCVASTWVKRSEVMTKLRRTKMMPNSMAKGRAGSRSANSVRQACRKHSGSHSRVPAARSEGAPRRA